jgi:hypothetical protein
MELPSDNEALAATATVVLSTSYQGLTSVKRLGAETEEVEAYAFQVPPKLAAVALAVQNVSMPANPPKLPSWVTELKKTRLCAAGAATCEAELVADADDLPDDPIIFEHAVKEKITSAHMKT